MKSPLSLKMRAIALLSQREHSPAELRRKLLRISLEMKTAAAARPAAEGMPTRTGALPPHDLDDEAGGLAAEVDALLAWLQAQGYLSEARFVESRIHARASRYGSLRIKQELAQHGVALSVEKQAELKASEAERARAVWQRKFGGGTETPTAADPAQRARQIRFLSARGFAPDIVRRVVLRAAGDE